MGPYRTHGLHPVPTTWFTVVNYQGILMFYGYRQTLILRLIMLVTWQVTIQKIRS